MPNLMINYEPKIYTIDSVCTYKEFLIDYVALKTVSCYSKRNL